MGKVLKGSAVSAERYTLGVPAPAGHVPPVPANSDDVDDWEPFVAPLAIEPAAEPGVDFERLRAEAQVITDDAARSAREIIEDAQQQANAITEAAEQSAAAFVVDARRAAHQAGRADGVQEAQAEMTAMLETMHGLLESTRSERHALISSAEPELVRLAVAIAERVLHGQIALDHGVVVEMAKAAIARIVDRENITVRVNPADVDRMRLHRDALLALGDVKIMRVIEDQRVGRGGVILETDAGSVDAKISTQLSEVRKILHIVDDVVVQPVAPAEDDADEPALSAARAS